MSYLCEELFIITEQVVGTNVPEENKPEPLSFGFWPKNQYAIMSLIFLIGSSVLTYYDFRK